VQQNRAGSHQADSLASAEDLRMVEALRSGDESAFVLLIDQYHASMLRLAMVFVPSQAVAEEVVQEAWMGVLQGLDRFEGRSSLKTWVFRILVNRAMTRGAREARSVPFAALAARETGADEPAVDPDRFARDGAWASPPRRWEDSPELKARS